MFHLQVIASLICFEDMTHHYAGLVCGIIPVSCSLRSFHVAMTSHKRPLTHPGNPPNSRASRKRLPLSDIVEDALPDSIPTPRCGSLLLRRSEEYFLRSHRVLRRVFFLNHEKSTNLSVRLYPTTIISLSWKWAERSFCLFHSRTRM